MLKSIPARCAFQVRASLLKLLNTAEHAEECARAQQKLQLAANVFAYAGEGIMVTNALGDIVDVNAAFTDITGYAHDEVLGRNPRLLASGRQDLAFYQAMWHELHAQGRWRGEVWNRRKDGELYAEMLTISVVRDVHGQVLQYVGLFSDITQRKAQEEQVWQLAFYDPLTQLPNRRLLQDRMLQAMAQSERSAQFGAVMYLDLDNFKPLNDLHGHGAGDLLLIEVAERLKRAVRAMDTVARVGGDEFVVLLGELGADHDAACAQAGAVAEKIRLALAQTYCVNLPHDGTATPIEHHGSASVGVVLFWQYTQSADQLLQWADAAMYRAKALGRNRVQLHTA